MNPPLILAGRKYLDVKFRHHGRSSHALDCIGFVRISYADCGDPLPDVRQYGREPRDGRLMQKIIEVMGQPVGTGPDADMQPGDMGVFHYNDEPHHVGLIGWLPYGGLSLLHADSLAGKVVEHRLDGVWRQRLVAVFRRPIP